MQEGIILMEGTLFLSGKTMVMVLILSAVVFAAVFTAVARPRCLFGERTSGASGRKLGLFLALLAATGVLIFPLLLLIQKGNVLTTIPLLGVRLLQAIILDNGYVDYIAGLPEGRLATLYYCLIGCAYIALPLVGAMNVYDLIMQNLSRLATARTTGSACRGRNVFLFSDFNENTYGLAQDLLRRDGRALVVFGSMSKLERDTWSTEITRLGTDRVKCFEADYCDLAVRFCQTFRFATLKCFAISAHCEADVAQTCRTLRALRKLRTFGGFEGQARVARVRLFVTSDSVDDQIVLDAANGRGQDDSNAPSLRLTVLNEATMATYDLLYRAPLHCVLDDEPVPAGGIRPTSPTELSVLVLGSGRFAEEALKAVLWHGQMHNVALNVDVAAPDAQQMGERVFMRYPELVSSARFSLRFTDVPMLSPRLDTAYLHRYGSCEHLYMIVALEDDALSFEVAMHARMFFLSQWTSRAEDVGKHPFIACLVRNEATSSLITTQFDAGMPGYGLVPYGCSRKLFGFHGIIDSPLERAGQAAADLYDVLWSGLQGTDFAKDEVEVSAVREAVRKSLAEAGDSVFEDTEARPGGGISCMPQIRHNSNLALALHARYKAWAQGAMNGDGTVVLSAVAKDGASSSSGPQLPDLTDEACLALGLREHDRWTVFYQTQGFTYLGLEEQERMSRLLAGQNALHKIEPLRKHTLICENDEIWPNYLHAVSGFAYQERSDVPAGMGQASVRATGCFDASETVVLQLLDSDYRVIDEWESDEQAHLCEGLADGAYIVHPAQALRGRACASDMTFELREGAAFVRGAQVDVVEVDVSGSPLVNPVIYDWAFAIASPFLVSRQ